MADRFVHPRRRRVEACAQLPGQFDQKVDLMLLVEIILVVDVDAVEVQIRRQSNEFFGQARRLVQAVLPAIGRAFPDAALAGPTWRSSSDALKTPLKLNI